MDACSISIKTSSVHLLARTPHGRHRYGTREQTRKARPKGLIYDADVHAKAAHHCTRLGKITLRLCLFVACQTTAASPLLPVKVCTYNKKLSCGSSMASPVMWIGGCCTVCLRLASFTRLSLSPLVSCLLRQPLRLLLCLRPRSLPEPIEPPCTMSISCDPGRGHHH